MADDRRQRRRRSHRRKALVLGVTVVVVAAGASTAWAMSGSDGPSYRLATVTRADIAQTVNADGTLSSQDTATQAFAASGTVESVLVRTGEKVRAGQVLALLDRSSLKADVTSAKNTLAAAEQTLADNEAGQASPSSTSTGATTAGATSTDGVTTDAAVAGGVRDSVVLVSDRTSTSDTTVAGARAEVTKAQKAVVQAQSALDGYVADLTSACTTSDDTETSLQVTAGSDGTASGTVEDAAVVTIADGTTSSDNPQTVTSGGSWSFAGLVAGQTYRVVEVPVIDDSACTRAIDDVATAKGSTDSTSTGTLYGALTALTDAIGDLETAAASAAASGSTSGSGSGGGTTTGSSSGSSSGTGTGSATGGGSSTSGASSSGGSGSPRGSSSTGSGASAGSSSSSSSGSSSGSSGSDGSSTTTTITAAQIAADQKAIDAARAALAVARNDMGLSTLTTPISGTIASVGITSGSTISASSSADTIVITTDEALSVPVDISLADIDLIKVGQSASVAVDGRSEPLEATVSTIGLSNTSSSTGSSSQYQVTLVLDERYAKLYDGMGATVSIDVGTARRAISVPVSAISTSGTTSSVSTFSNGTVSTKTVELGVEGTSRVQVTSGLSLGDQVVLADLDAALPSSDSDSTSGSPLTSGLSGSNTGPGGTSGGSFSGAPGGGSGGSGGPP